MQEKIAHAATAVGSGVAAGTPPTLLYFGLTPTEISLLFQLCGVLVGAIGGAATIWFQWDKRERERRQPGERRVQERRQGERRKNVRETKP